MERNSVQWEPEERAGARLRSGSHWGDSNLIFDSLTFRILRYRALAIVAAVLLILCAVGPVVMAVPTTGDSSDSHSDALADAVPRQTDPGGNLAFDILAHRLPDLVEVHLAAFFPFDASVTLFDGVSDPSSSSADFFRLDLILDGLANPGGSVDPLGYAPFVYGDNPVYGFVEIDMDEEPDTGGELEAPQYRYLANAARFGGMIGEEEIQDRVAIDASAFDDNFLTAPQIERSGEEFHLAMLGGEFSPSDIIEIEGDGDFIFGAGETWQMTALFFHRAHGFAPFSFVKGGPHPGEYEPESTLQFAHDIDANQTVISLVFPLTQDGAAMISGAAVEDLNLDPTDQASVEEALFDAVLSADFLSKFPSGDPEEAILVGWANRDAVSYLAPSDWDVTVLLGSAYTESSPSGVYYLWSDVHPDIVRGDVDGDEEFDPDDEDLIAGYIATKDALDGIIDGTVVIAEFGSNFSLFDVNQDGVVSTFDIVASQSDGDDDDDNDIDLADVAALQRCFGVDSMEFNICIGVDIDINGVVELVDADKLGRMMTGPK